ncbi:MAG: hypothetical protein IKV66_01115 [Clostridia bacterium]|nr:hypothetical protein [Clostridia bacterium]
MKSNNNRRVFAWLLTLCAALPVLASCGGDATAQAPIDTNPIADTVTETAAETEPLDPLEARKLVDDELGEKDLGGYEFRVMVSEAGGRTNTVWVDGLTGDVVNDAVFERNAAVEERFNCKIVLAADYQNYSKLSPLLTKAVKAGDDVYDLLSFHVVELGKLALSNYFYNWYDVPNIDFSKPWWSDSTVEDLTYNGICPVAVGDMALSALSAAYCVFYNKKLGEDYDFPDLYAVVENGEWTIDRAVELTKGIYQDLNGSGTVDTQEDLFGYVSDSYSNFAAYLWSFDNPVFRKNGDILEYSYKTEKIADMVSKLCEIFSQYDGIKHDKKHVNPEGRGSNDYGRDQFAKGHAVLANGYISQSLTHFRELQDEYGILPYPKWDEAQENYYTMSDGNHEALAVPKTVQNIEAVGTITEAMCAESYKILVPAYYDVALKVKSTRDEQSIAMLDRIVNARVFDFGFVYNAGNGAAFLIQDLINNNNDNFESTYAKKEKSITKHYNKVIEFFETYGENE